MTADPNLEGVRARRLAISPEHIVEDGFLVIDRSKGIVAASGTRKELKRDFSDMSGPVRDVPGTVLAAPLNCHTHLELSHLAGALTQGQGFTTWLKSMLEVDVFGCQPEHLDQAVKQLRACGTGLVADICSRKPRDVHAALSRGGVGVLLQAEEFGYTPLPEKGFQLPRAFARLEPDVQESVGAAGHALYSTHPSRLRAARAWSLERGRPFSLHLAEHQDEVEMLATGTGEFMDLLCRRILPKDFMPPGKSPVRRAHDLGLLGPGTLAVHCVHVDRDEARLLAETGTSVCLCPRSNEAIGVGRAPARDFLDAGVRLCLGTDSLASNSDLDIWQELGALLPYVPLSLRSALAMLTSDAARALGVDGLHGSLERGRRAAWTVMPDHIEDMLGQDD